MMTVKFSPRVAHNGSAGSLLGSRLNGFDFFEPVSNETAA
jgi:hypothetical protein